jgi:hypothetical protein
MDYTGTLQKLERLRELAEYRERGRTREEMQELTVLYGELEEVFRQFLPEQKIQVEMSGPRGANAFFPNLFAAGYLSGRTFHTGAGYNELLMLIGKVKAASERAPKVRDESSISALVRVLQRYRQCCQYLKQPPGNEKDVQDILWIMLRSHSDRVDREDVLPRFGTKTYRPDFGMPDLGVLIEAKFVGERTEVAKLQEEILADIPGYLQEGSKFTGIVVLVYDAAHKLRDERKFVEELRRVDGILDVMVVPGVG